MRYTLILLIGFAVTLGYCQTSEELNVVSEINAYRAGLKLPELKYDLYASNICLDHNRWQFESDTFCHCNIQERWKLLHNNGGYNGGENLCKDCKTPVLEWIKSPSHNNILKKEDANSIGISIYNNHSTVLIFKRN